MPQYIERTVNYLYITKERLILYNPVGYEVIDDIRYTLDKVIHVESDQKSWVKFVLFKPEHQLFVKTKEGLIITGAEAWNTAFWLRPYNVYKGAKGGRTEQIYYGNFHTELREISPQELQLIMHREALEDNCLIDE